jgi:hypothetical protein
MKSNQHIEDRIWDFIDGNINENDRLEIQQLLKENETWKQTYDELLFLNNTLKSSQLEEPSMRFSLNVMDSIQKNRVSTVKKYINQKIIWFISFFFITIISGLLIYGFGQVEWNFSNSGNFTVPVNIPDIDYGFLKNNIFIQSMIIINVVLALMLFDNFLNSKKRFQY